MPRFVGFIGPSYTLASKNVDCQRCLNLYPEINELGTGKEKEIAWLAPTPGLRRLVTVGAGPIRGIYSSSQNELFVVSGNQLYRISSAWVATALGSTLLTASGPVGMADNGLQLVVVDGTNGYSWDFTAATLTQLSGPGWLGSYSVVEQDGYFIFVKPNSNQFYISGLNGVTLDPLDISSSEGSPDNIIAQISDHRNVWLFNDQTTEIFYDSGNADFPFERMQGAYIETGIAAKYSAAKANGTVFWLGKDAKGGGIVYMASGLQPVRISTHAIETDLKKYSTIADATAYCYQDGGHTFYVLNFPTASRTWVFDAMTKLWHERSWTLNGQMLRHRADNHAYAFGTHVVGDWENGKLYALESTAKSDDGDFIMRKRSSPHIAEDGALLFHEEFWLDIESGVGLDGIGQGTNPQIMMKMSNDGGHTWSNEKWTDLGKIGERKTRPIWRRLGQARDRVYEITITDPVTVNIIGANLRITKGAS